MKKRENWIIERKRNSKLFSPCAIGNFIEKYYNYFEEDGNIFVNCECVEITEP